MRELLVLAIALGVATSALADSKRAFTTAERSKAATSIAAARREFNKQMLDYQTARFRDVSAVVGGPARAVRLCGYVNGRNRMGAYVGWSRFVYLPIDSDGLIIDEPGVEDGVAAVLCNPESDDTVWDTRDYSTDLTHRP